MFRKKVEKKESSNVEDFLNFGQFGVTTIKDKDVEAEYNQLMLDSMNDEDDELDAILNEFDGATNFNAPDALPQDIANILAGTVVSSDDTYIEVNEQDLTDPIFQQELAALGFKPSSNSAQTTQDKIEAEKHTALRLKRSGDIQGALEAMRRIKALEEQLNEEGKDAVDPKVEVTDDDMENPEYLNELEGLNQPDEVENIKAQIQLEQQTAVRLKRGGDIPGALEALRKVKALEQRLEEAKVGKPNDKDIDVQVTDEDMENPEYLAELEGLSQPRAEEMSVKRKPIQEHKRPQEVIIPTEVKEEQPLESVSPASLREQITLKKQAALRLRREGQKSEALGALRRVKQLQKQLEVLEEDSGDRRLEAFSKLEQELVSFANRLMTEAKDMAAKDRVRAAELVKTRKYYTDELEKLRIARQDPRQRPPGYEIQTVSENVEIQLSEIDPAELHVHIGSAVGLKQFKAKDIYINFSIGVPTDNPVGGMTEAVTGGPDFEFNKLFRLPLRRSKGTQKSFGIRKAVFEVWRNRSLMRSPELVGKAYQELKVLLDRCEVLANLPIVDSNRRSVGGKLQVKLRMRTPLSEKQVRVVSTSKLVVGAYPPIVEHPPSPVPILPPPPAAAAVVEPRPGPGLRRSFSRQLQDIDDPHNVDLIVSYDVMDAELSTANASLQQKLSTEDREALELRQELLQTKKQMLEIEMQSGQLTLPLYIERLNSKIGEDRLLAASLSKQGHKQDAVRVLRRLKMMEKEVAGAINN